MLEEGYDTEHLRMLASLGPDPSHADTDYYFGQTVQELNWIIPPTPILLRLYAKDVAQSIVEGTMSPDDGCSEIYSIYRDLDHPADLKSWLYLYDNLEPETYEELEGENWDIAVRQEAWRFLQTMRV